MVLPRPCVTRYARINKFAEVCFERNWYSVPTRWAHRNAVIEVYERQLRIVVEAEVVAEHQRGYGAGERFLDPRHYITLLAHKHRAAESALVLSDGRIPDVLRDLFDRYCQTDSRSATKRWTQVLSLLSDVPVAELAQVVTHALARGTDDPAAIALMLEQNRAPAPSPAIRTSALPDKARCDVPVVNLEAYAIALLIERAA
jgi:hypothetical protein